MQDESQREAELERVTREALFRENWFRGQLYHLLRPDAQSRLYNFIKAWKARYPIFPGPLVLNCHRGLGKSHLLHLLAVERALEFPNQQVRLGGPTRKQISKVSKPIIRTILLSCPHELQPTLLDDTYSFRNPRWNDLNAVSELHLVSCKDCAESERGPRSDLVLIDEARDIANLEYVLDSVFGFHFVGREFPLEIISSTPPDSSDHPYSSRYVPDAAEEGRYIVIPVTENKDWRDQDDWALKKLCRGKETVAWRREALCKLESNPERMIVPEWSEEGTPEAIVVDEYQRPQHFFPYMCMDTGWVDFTAMIWFFVDWHKQIMVVERTELVRKKHTGFIAQLIKQTELELYGEIGPHHPITRVGDLTPQQLDDLEVQYGVTVLPAKERNDPDANISELRSKIADRKIRIIRAPNESLIYQLKNGTRDEETGKIIRTKTMGHWDAGMALAYGSKEVDFWGNPNPRASYNKETHFLAPNEKLDEPLTITREPLKITRHKLWK